MAAKITQKGLIFEYYENRPNQDIETPEVVDWATTVYLRLTGRHLRDPDRMIRSLYEEGKLIKVETGVYRYDPDAVSEGDDLNFTAAQKSEILERGGYRCAICGATKATGTNLHIDHVRPRSKGGKAAIDNGQVLCSRHNNLKKNYGQTETCKRMYRAIYQQAVAANDITMLRFVEDVMRVYDEHNINSHIDWRPELRSSP